MKRLDLDKIHLPMSRTEFSSVSEKDRIEQGKTKGMFTFSRHHPSIADVFERYIYMQKCQATVS